MGKSQIHPGDSAFDDKRQANRGFPCHKRAGEMAKEKATGREAGTDE